VLRAALDEALDGPKDATLVLPYATSALAKAVRAIAPTSLLLLEAADAWLLSTHAELEQHFQTRAFADRAHPEAGQNRMRASPSSASIIDR
jgi:lactam utilization protein B